MKPETKAKYPRNWKEISRAARDRAGHKCQWCGTESKPRNVLTVHHVDYNPGNNEPGNLLVLCQKCHLRFQQQRRIKLPKEEPAEQGRLELPLDNTT